MSSYLFTCFFFFKQKTAYEMRISDWSSDVCSSDLQVKIDLAPLFPAVPAFEQAAESELVRLAERLTGHQAEAVAFATEAPYLQQIGRASCRERVCQYV